MTAFPGFIAALTLVMWLAPQIQARGMVLDVEREDGTHIAGLRPPITFPDAELALGRPSPLRPRRDEN